MKVLFRIPKVTEKLKVTNMSDKHIVNESEDIQGNRELESLETEANAGLLPPNDFVFEVNGDVYNEERIIR